MENSSSLGQLKVTHCKVRGGSSLGSHRSAPGQLCLSVAVSVLNLPGEGNNRCLRPGMRCKDFRVHWELKSYHQSLPTHTHSLPVSQKTRLVLKSWGEETETEVLRKGRRGRSRPGS